MAPEPTNNPNVPRRNGPTVCAHLPPIEANSTIGTANNVMPRLAIRVAGVQIVEHQRPQRVERADHHEHRGAHRQCRQVWTNAQQIERKPRWDLGVNIGFGDMHSGDQRIDRDRQRGDQQERRGDPERADQHRRDGRAHREPGDVGRQHSSEVLAQVVGIGQDHDATRRRIRQADACTHHEPRHQQHDHTGAVGHPQKPGDVEHHPEDDHQPCMPSIGEWGDRHLGDERRQEAHCHDQPERTFTDPVLVAKLVEHGEHHAVSRGEQPGQRAENDDHRASTHSASITDGPGNRRVD